MRKQRILLVHNEYQISGGEDTVVKNERRMLEDHGHEVFCYFRNNNEIKNMSFFAKLVLPITTIFSWKTYFEVQKLIKQHHIDIVHVHNVQNLISPAVFYAAKRRKIPVVQTIHNFRMICPNGLLYRDCKICEECPQFGLNHAISHSCYRKSKLQTIIIALSMKLHRMLGIYRNVFFVCLTEFNKKKLLEINKTKEIVSEKKIFVKPNYMIKPLEKSTKKEDYYMYLSRLEESKGIKELLRSWKTIDKKLKIYGTGPAMEWCKNYIEKNQMDQVELCGFLPHEKVFSELAKAKALIIPSLWYEGFPMIILEAISVKTPLIGYGIGNVKDIIESNNYGLIYHNQEQLQRIIDENQIEEYPVNYDVTIFQEENNYRQLKNIYDKIEESDVR